MTTEYTATEYTYEETWIDGDDEPTIGEYYLADYSNIPDTTPWEVVQYDHHRKSWISVGGEPLLNPKRVMILPE